MDEEMLENIKKQHMDNYRNSIIDIIHNNTNVLVYDDIASLLKTPPLDSMDFLKMKILNFAKKNKIVLNSASLDDILNKYRLEVLKCCSEIVKIREEYLSSIVLKTILVSSEDVIRINKKDFLFINKEIKKMMKEKLAISFEKKLLKKIDIIFPDDVNADVKSSFIGYFTKYMKTTYQKQILEHVDIKILVKDTTLINNVKEQTQRYLFTMKNSRLLNASL